VLGGLEFCLVSVRCVLLEVQRCAVVLLLVWKGDRRAGFIAGGARLLGGKALSLRVILPHDTWGGGAGDQHAKGHIPWLPVPGAEAAHVGLRRCS